MTPDGKGPHRRAQRRAFQQDERRRARKPMTFAEHTDAMIVATALASVPSGDPQEVAETAMSLLYEVLGDYDTQLFADAAADYAAIEDGSL